MNLSRYTRWGGASDTDGDGAMLARIIALVGLYTAAMLLILV